MIRPLALIVVLSLAGGAWTPSSGRSIVAAPLRSAGDLSMLLGGGDSDEAYAVAVDANGAIYVAGATWSRDFSTTPGALRATADDPKEDVFVAKLRPDGSGLELAAVFGGAGMDRALAIALGPDGSIYVAGETDSRDFPATLGAYTDRYRGGLYDAFVARLRPDGSGLIYATLLGGQSAERVGGIAVAADGSIYIGGTTSSPDFPTTPGAFDQQRDGFFDGYVAKLRPDGSGLVYSTLLGGSDGRLAGDFVRGIAVDANGAVYVAGETGSTDFPTTADAVAPTYLGAYSDGFLVRIAPDGGALEYGTFLGGAGRDVARGVGLGPDGSAFVAGHTDSADLPSTVNAAWPAYRGGERDSFLIRLFADDRGLQLVTYVGGDGNDGSTADRDVSVTVDASGRVAVAGWTNSEDLPTTPSAPRSSPAGDVDGFVVVFAADGEVMFASYLGGSRGDRPRSIALDPTGAPIVVGGTDSADFPATSSAPDRKRGRSEGFVVRFAAPETPIGS